MQYLYSCDKENVLKISEIEIIAKALELGYDKCGIIPVQSMLGFESKLDERINQFPESKEKYEPFRAFASPHFKYPWAKAIIVCTYWYGKYQIPENLNGTIGKYYLTDSRTNTSSAGYKTSAAFEEYLKELDLRVVSDKLFGITSLRWAALKSGIGIVRKNNFLYTEKGSWQYIEAFLIDRPLEYIVDSNLKPCPDNCSLCIENCPTSSLSSPYMTNRNTCISCLTTFDGWDLASEPLSYKMGSWFYGCDACQDRCPYNQNKWISTDAFPNLKELGDKFSLTSIVESSYSCLQNYLQPILWYIPIDKCWRFKTNALNIMLNDFKPEYLTSIQIACNDEKEEVRVMANWVLQQLQQK